MNGSIVVRDEKKHTHDERGVEGGLNQIKLCDGVLFLSSRSQQQQKKKVCRQNSNVECRKQRMFFLMPESTSAFNITKL